MMTGSRPGLYWMICWKYLSPCAMITILLASFYQLLTEGSSYPAWIAAKGLTEKLEWPHWCIVIAFFLILSSILWIPIVAILRYVRASVTLCASFVNKLCIFYLDYVALRWWKIQIPHGSQRQSSKRCTALCHMNLPKSNAPYFVSIWMAQRACAVQNMACQRNRSKKRSKYTQEARNNA